jgi:hypothetical protein
MQQNPQQQKTLESGLSESNEEHAYQPLHGRRAFALMGSSELGIF